LSKKRDASILVRGARVHNLNNIDAEIPLNSITVVTGVSGSGKSSLAFDTLYSEGQRRYVASLSAYARQFLERVDRPDVDDMIGLCPALAIRQRNYARNPRSTVGTVTEINDYLRLLYARIGSTICRECGRIVEKDTPEKIAEFVLSLPRETRLYLCMPLNLDAEDRCDTASRAEAGNPIRSASSKLRMILPGLQKQGFARLLIGEKTVDLSEALAAFRASKSREIYVVVDRLVVRDDMRGRLVDSLELCGRESGGRIEVLLLGDSLQRLEDLLESGFPQVRWVRHPAGILCKFSERFECQLCHRSYEEPEPRLFSFNNPFGACPDCQGFGNTITLDLGRVIPDGSLSLAEGAVNPWIKPRYGSYHNRLIQFASHHNIDIHLPWDELSSQHQEWIIQGKGQFAGILGFFDRLEEKKYKMHIRIFISRYRGYTLCPTCSGDRLRAEARDVFVGGKSITEITQMTIDDARRFFAGLDLTSHQREISGKILDEILHRLDLLHRVGLEYIALDRLSSSLSGGESQRIQLATSLGSTLVGTLYVLDEPSIGLHPRDTQRLIKILESLKTLGNTVLVVEHDPEIMKAADHLIDLGPRAGENGGDVVFQGSYRNMLKSQESLTGKYLAGKLKISTPIFRRKGNGQFLEIINARKHNLKNLNLRIPLGILICVTGVSGSGKSTLVHDVLFRAVKGANGKTEASDGYDEVRGKQSISDIILVDQSPIGRTPRSNPVTYIKAFDSVREAFANTRDAFARNLKASHFSFNLAGGRCETCQGNGTITVEMQFLADVELTCDDCGGTRFKSSVLEVQYKGKNIAEVLGLTVRQAIDFFSGQTKLLRKLRVLDDIGLGYLRLGQSASSLSGGEAQRVKLATFIASKNTKNNLFLFDEPTTGLHFDDIRRLITAFDRLIHSGNSVVVIEHNLDIIKTADWIIDLGLEGGDAGGSVVFEGSPDDLTQCKNSYTGRFLKRHLRPS
jgi:excinuclease ABC subunit A